MQTVNPTGKHRPKRRHHGEGSRAFRRKGERRQRPWACTLRMGSDPVTGRPRVRWFSGTSAAEAEAGRDEYLRRLRRAGSAEAAERTVAAALTAHLARVRDRGVDPSTMRRYERVVEQHLAPSLGHLLVTDLDAAAIDSAAASWRNQRPLRAPDGSLLTPAPLSPASRTLAIGVLRDAIGPAIRQGVLADPFPDVRRQRRGAPVARHLDRSEARTLLDAMRGDPLELLVTLAIAVGPRRGELLGIRWGDLDLDAARWTVGLQVRWIPVEARSEGEGPYRLVGVKAEHSAGRAVPLPAFAVGALRAHREEWSARKRRARMWAKPGDLVLCDDLGQALPPGSVTRRFEALAGRAGLGHLRLHDLRHSSATLMLEMGVDQRTIQHILGHATGQQTAGYAAVVESMGRHAADAMDGAFPARRLANG